MRVLFIGDNSSLSKQIEASLSNVDIKTDISLFKRNVNQVIGANLYNLIIMNSSDPGPTEIGLISNLRKDQVPTPIMVMSASFSQPDKIAILNAGADACLDLPCTPSLLVAYVKAVIRRDQHVTFAKLIQIEQLCINTRSCSVRIGDKQILLTADEYKLLLLLAEHEGIAVSKKKMSQRMHIHDNHFGESNIPAVFVTRIRKKFKGVSEKNYIITVRGVGYMLCA